MRIGQPDRRAEAQQVGDLRHPVRVLDQIGDRVLVGVGFDPHRRR
jgi:hypothetical protein